ncbi:MAG: hypothetical protein ACK5MN_06235 [Lachnospiraceae bacterium]
MAEFYEFKTTIMGGFDKDDVQEKFKVAMEESTEAQNKLRKEIEDRDEKIAQLKKRIELKELQQERLEAEIQDKYKKYVDKYDSIGRLVFDAQVKADAIVDEAKNRGREIIAKAEVDALTRVNSVQNNIDDQLQDGKRKYVAIQEEIDQIVELVNQAQIRFMESYREIHGIVRDMPEFIQKIEDEEAEAPEEAPFLSHLHEEEFSDERYEEDSDTVDEDDELDEDEDRELMKAVEAFLDEDEEIE